MDVKIKKLASNAVIPKYSRDLDAALDITATSVTIDNENNVISYGTGLAFQIPPGYCALLLPRSSIFKKDFILSNSCGLLDAGFLDEVHFKFRFRPGTDKIYKVGDRIGQILIIQNPRIEFIEVDRLTGYNRGGGFGSTNV